MHCHALPCTAVHCRALTFSPLRAAELADAMTDRLGGAWSTQDVSRALNESGFVWKRVINLPAETDPEKMKSYRETCFARDYSTESYVFMDEVGTVR